jgi:hypothetical protein
MPPSAASEASGDDGETNIEERIVEKKRTRHVVDIGLDNNPEAVGLALVLPYFGGGVLA